MFAKIKIPTMVYAAKIGENSILEERLIKEKILVPLSNEYYNLRTEKSEFNIIQSGEYILFDEDKKYSQVISKIDFEKKYKRKFENIYEEVQTPICIYIHGEKLLPEIVFLLKERKLFLTPHGWEKPIPSGGIEYYRNDDVIFFDHVIKDEKGEIVDISFHFIRLSIFNKYYYIC